MLITFTFTETTKELARTITGIKQKSALNPFLWVLGVVLLICSASAYFFKDDLAVKWLFLSMAVLTLVCVLFVSVYFAIKAPDKLRSEEYQVHHDLLQYKEHTQTTPENTIDKVAINQTTIEYRGEK
jgi:amino acid permease